MEIGNSVLNFGTEKKFPDTYTEIPLIILDEWLMADMHIDELHFFHELMKRCSDPTSKIFCSRCAKKDLSKEPEP